MGYFPNGTSGAMYYERWCSKCLHDNEEAGLCCPIWNLHLLHNYEECNKTGSFLHALIPLSNDTDALDAMRCTMFVDRGLLSNLAIEKFEFDAIQPEARS